MRLVIQIVLWALIAFLGYQLYTSISEPDKFNKVKTERYQKVISNLKDIRSAQLAHQEITGSFTGSFDSLTRFLDTAQFALKVRKDTFYADQKKNKAYGLDPLTGGYIIEESIIDTIGFIKVTDSLYKGSDRYKRMMNIPIEGVDKKVSLKAGKLETKSGVYSVFEAKVAKGDVLADQSNDLLVQEKQVISSVVGVKGAYIRVGSMNSINTNGNWSKEYDSAKDKQ